ncbi:hypothetical protein [Stomatohabitans albus]|uniref:hypothetical protein n=1 Tax=Stomatohabitans albus TaxID=3110766 RepID=UPI00300D3418
MFQQHHKDALLHYRPIRQPADHEQGATALTVLLALTATVAVALAIMAAASDALSTYQHGQHVADMMAVTLMQESPLVGGVGTPDRGLLTRIAIHEHVQVINVDTTGWPLEIRVHIRAEPTGVLRGLWSGVLAEGAAEVIPPPTQ